MRALCRIRSEKKMVQPALHFTDKTIACIPRNGTTHRRAAIVLLASVASSSSDQDNASPQLHRPRRINVTPRPFSFSRKAAGPDVLDSSMRRSLNTLARSFAPERSTSLTPGSLIKCDRSTNTREASSTRGRRRRAAALSTWCPNSG